MDEFENSQDPTVRMLARQVKRLQKNLTGQQLMNDGTAQKWRARCGSLERELQAIREKRPQSCSCPIGECRKLEEHVMGDTCWYQWAYSRRGVAAMLEKGPPPTKPG